MRLKEIVCTVIGAVGGGIAAIFGGWTAALTVLLICMGVDYVTGLIVAGVFHSSPKAPGAVWKARPAGRVCAARP